uniref:Ras-GEF domain-containing protein n=1 Tax=Trichobilharzia regenti TaxID=157069 RepID=A0AA85K9T9_TRIRE|nr:unnamed protein product [Trichobilharzia regenti]
MPFYNFYINPYRFWNMCHSGSLSTSWKVGIISSFQFLLNAWLQQPHLKDFDSPQKVTYLKRLIRIIADWFDIFQTSSSSQSSHVYALKDFMKCCGNNLPPSKNKGVTRIMLCNIDSEIWDRLTTDMEVLCRRAVNCLKHIACKYQIDLNPEKEFLPSHTVSVNRDYRYHSPHNHSMFKSKSLSKETVIIPPTVNPLINLWNLNANTVAEQLTVADQRLFLSIELNDCLIYARGKPAPSVQATIDQYNKLYQFVQSSVFNSDQDYPILVEPTPIHSRRFRRPDQSNSSATRVSPQIITIWSKNSNYPTNYQSPTSDIGKLKTGCIITWINIAYRLGQTRNYSALKAIIMALQSTPIHRLWHSWNVLEYHYHEHFLKFKHLASIVSFDNNQEQLRKRLNKCAKKMYWYLKLNNPNPLCGDENKPGDIPQYETSEEKNNRNNNEPLTISHNSSYLSGVIPYLGVFLSDLTLLHHSSPDYVSRSKYQSNHQNNTGNRIGNSNNASPVLNSSNKNNTNNTIPSIQIDKNHDNTTDRLIYVSNPLSSFARSTPNLLSPQSYDRMNSNNNIKQSTKLVKIISPTPLISDSRSSNSRTVEDVKKTKSSRSRRHSTTDNNNDEKLINLDKHRREFKILANLFLLQQNAQLYSLRPEPDFELWFQSYPLITEKEALLRSCDMEPDDEQLQQMNRPFSASPYSFGEGGVTTAVNTMNNRKAQYSRNNRIERTKYATSQPPSASPDINTITGNSISPNISVASNPAGRSNKLYVSSSQSMNDLLNGSKHERLLPTSENNLKSVHNQSEQKLQTKVSANKLMPRSSPSAKGSSPIYLDGISSNNLLINVTFHETHLQHDGRVSPFLAKVAYLGGRSHGSSHNDNHYLQSRQAPTSVDLTVSSTDTVSDVLFRALRSFGRTDQSVDNYDLIQIRKDERHVVLQKNANFYESIHYPSLYASNNTKYHNPLEFIICTSLNNNNNMSHNNNNSITNSPSNTHHVKKNYNNNPNQHKKNQPNSVSPECARHYQLTNKSSNKRCVVELWS